MDKKLNILIDFGSTFTKVIVFDLEKEEIVASSYILSTVATDITIGLQQALDIISSKVNISSLEKHKALACSSAAGGLRMICIGFVPEYTSQAATYAALGAGAKVVGTFSYELGSQEIKDIEALHPDIVLLTGGTDGGDKKVIIHNSRLLSQCNELITNIIVAGNKSANDEITTIFEGSNKKVLFAKNVMPEIGKLDLTPCNQKIREIFMKNIIEAKGIARARTIIKDVIMPTPSAVLEAAKLIANGCEGSSGLGELLVVDVGGATTDVYSIAEGAPQHGDVVIAGLPEPYAKRTVEGDLGLKYNVDTLIDLVQKKEVSDSFLSTARRFCEGKLPETQEEIECHRLLSRLAVEVAIDRHAGKVEALYGPSGEILIQHGKDLTEVKHIIGTGGPLVYSSNPREVLEGALFQKEKSSILKPKKLEYYLDQSYILFAVGLLSQVEPLHALNIAKKYLKQI